MSVSLSVRRSVRGRSLRAAAAASALAVAATLVPAAGSWAAGGAAEPAAPEICNLHCDGRDASLAPDERAPVSATVAGRTVTLRVSDSDPMGWASVDGAAAGDEVWLDRSFDGGETWADGARLGATTVPDGASGARTLMYNNDDWTTKRVGALRACASVAGQAGCTAWARTTWNAGNRTTAAATAMMATYDNETGLFHHDQWWPSAVALSAVIENADVAGMGSYEYAIARTYDANVDAQGGQFRNEYVDDTGWWAVAWIDAYDLTGEQRYLDTARAAAEHMHDAWDERCGGGVVWKVGGDYKAAIANSLYLQVNALLHERVAGDTAYLARATAEWDWFRGSGLLGDDDLVADGVTAPACTPGGTTFTYNQGVLVSGLVGLHAATGDAALLGTARDVADATTAPGALTTSGGVLRDPAEGWDTCAGDGATFKAAAVRGLVDLDGALDGQPYAAYLAHNADTAHAQARNAFDQYGISWSGPAGATGVGCQSSALALMNAAASDPVDPVDPALAVDTTVVPRCVGGNAYLAVRATNGEDGALRIGIATDYGTPAERTVRPGTSASAALNARRPALPPGEVTVTASGTVDGEARTATTRVGYATVDCR
ncbi:glycoside hydrolase family 76 protein [Cellulomonas sp. PhB143]|uniref:glycoside hydrolase family 76 protein n=1 Tax=Cellulomonas sp. PhB143 TaxID=2485186 RepID=UPI000F48CB7F|nr:glycoside hydrolase family 76 protein [Cellulomonas sp. PhB143]ROS78887.1 putative alpha-1,6-mannanase (GH76 family) [Cellulomonas sp. PhB143]